MTGRNKHRTKARNQDGTRVRKAIIHGKPVRVAYEHSWVARCAHWLNAVSLFVLIGSGLRIYLAFPSFGPKIPQTNFVHVPPKLTLGGWLAGALQWHFAFMWIFVATGLIYLAYQLLSGEFRQVLFTPRDLPGVWPMARHYFLFGKKPEATGPYNPLQKLAYTSTIFFGIATTLTGLVLYKPAQFAWLAFLMGGFHLARIWHFAAMCGFLAFIPGHLIMVLLHGWNNFVSMLTGWKKNPEYAREPGPSGGESLTLFLNCHPERGRTPESKDPHRAYPLIEGSGNSLETLKQAGAPVRSTRGMTPEQLTFCPALPSCTADPACSPSPPPRARSSSPVSHGYTGSSDYETASRQPPRQPAAPASPWPARYADLSTTPRCRTGHPPSKSRRRPPPPATSPPRSASSSLLRQFFSLQGHGFSRAGAP